MQQSLPKHLATTSYDQKHDRRQRTAASVDVGPAPAAEGTAEAAAEGEAAAEPTPAAEETAEGEEDEGGPHKPDYSKNMLEYVVASSGQVSLLVPALITTGVPKRMAAFRS